jgi:hypothetical protein
VFVALAVLASPALAEDPLADLMKGAEEATKARTEFFARYGVAPPDLEAKRIVAFKKGLRFAVIENDCAGQTVSPNAYLTCLDQREKAATMMGEDMMAIDPDMQRRRALLDKLLKGEGPPATPDH